ncbi:defect in organelle trafficking protein DotD [Kosakonia radicincitans]|uniref:Defect in organelle trafficking protein DotD n=1 Tax=Kosakonia radicincitans TaxID=283686 RepID=A0AAX2EZ34_9ENTR|nr:DotD/TraH family lipoprotein [Kosakonia radicincitans]SFF37934.1 defect in organelle trafficking protein DotD [Kosakonia radicincitans]SFR26218.1 defect in organelle trafficking protein DotD [Kosakonia radicincitans]SFU16713.1 defect in organelle trafficking protein DotD [Kosakonia radicincitans]SFY31939.1 defect in organelle trafficking protein DotD [Kosakonia radicincitans]
MKKNIITALPVLLLCGCQLNPQPPAAPHAPAQIKTTPPKSSLQLTQLWMEGNLRDGTPLPVASIRADSDRVTFSWNGDAVELLSQLARARGQTFSYAGVRLPLPVDIEVQSVTYANVLRMIEMQTAWRATLVTYPGQMVLQFMPSLPAEPVRYKKRGRG